MTKRGNALVDAQGMTLYTLTNAGKAVACTGSCASLWPPLTATSATVTGAQGVTGLATTKDANGTQVSHDGLPLYRYSGDTAAGDANGDGLTGFGGTWHIVAASGASTGSNTPAPPAPTPTTSSSSGGGGYGY
jgi:predicted lipoprotein with Yx(FWY)xxD motif